MLLLISSEMEKGQRKAIKITGQHQTRNRLALHGQSVANSKPSNNTKNNNTGIAANLAMPPAKLISICDYTLHPPSFCPWPLHKITKHWRQYRTPSTYQLPILISEWLAANKPPLSAILKPPTTERYPHPSPVPTHPPTTTSPQSDADHHRTVTGL